jgi:hypothetical protein
VGSDGQNGWNEYSRLVLKELESLGDNLETLRGEIQEIKQDIAKIHVREDKVDDIKVWKERLDDVCSPTQLKTVIDEVEGLKTFKIRSITVFAVIQFAMAATMWILNVMK